MLWNSPAQTRQSAQKATPVTPTIGCAAAPIAPLAQVNQPAPPTQTPIKQVQTPAKQVQTPPAKQVQTPPGQQVQQQQQQQQPANQNQAPPVEPMESESNLTDGGEDGSEVSGKGGRFRKPWSIIQKKPSIRAKERRIRQNRRLRKILLPKNALMALHEVKGVQMSDFQIINRTEGGFLARVAVNNIQYEGIGKSKMAAKNNACEKALRDHIIYTMMQAKLQPKEEEGANDESANANETENGNGDEDVEMKPTIEDNIPMLNLASFAIYKLFAEWEHDGFQIPDFRPNSNANGNGASEPATPTPPTPPVARTELPPNWETMHPASLLLIMRPGILFNHLGSEGQPPNTIQRVSILVDGEMFIGEARSQKLARRLAAVDACNKLFNTNFIKS